MNPGGQSWEGWPHPRTKEVQREGAGHLIKGKLNSHPGVPTPGMNSRPMTQSQRSGGETVVPRPAGTSPRRPQACWLTLTFEKQRRLMCVQVCVFSACHHPIPNHQRERPKPPHPHHAPTADPAVLPLPGRNQLMATNLWGLENAVKAVISGEGPQQYASWQVRMLGSDLVARGDSLQLDFLGREGHSRTCV